MILTKKFVSECARQDLAKINAPPSNLYETLLRQRHVQVRNVQCLILLGFFNTIKTWGKLFKAGLTLTLD